MPAPLGARFERLVTIMRALRAPDGCPWDREQTLESLRPYVLEETHEVLEAIEHGGPDDLCEELGDFLFEAVFLAQISDEAGHFDIGDALDAVCDKLVRRHPHVFAREDAGAPGDGPPRTGAEVLERWDELKARERALAGRPPKPKDDGALGGVPKGLPALLRAHTIGKKAANVGFDWPDAGGVLDKLDEEVAEIREAVTARDAATANDDAQAKVEEEIGDLLFAVANLSRKLGVEPEAALRRATGKFTRRFRAVEQAFEARGESLDGQTLDALEAEWQRVKAQLLT
jgi:MazG family protein